MFIPEKLLDLCTWLVQGATMESRVTGQLIQKLSSEQSQNTLEPVLAVIPQRSEAIFQVGRNYKYRGACWLSGLALLMLAWQYSGLFLLGLIPVSLLYYRNRKEEYDAVVFLSALLLSLEILAHDFAGWGAAFPRAKKQAHEILTRNPQNTKTGELLDFILLRDQNVEPDWADQFAPYQQNRAS